VSEYLNNNYSVMEHNFNDPDTKPENTENEYEYGFYEWLEMGETSISKPEEFDE
jgi:hypothetical protein